MSVLPGLCSNVAADDTVLNKPGLLNVMTICPL